MLFRRAAHLCIAAAVLLLMAGRTAPVSAAGVVGSGTPASCTHSALQTALGTGGTVTFNCGPDPVTIDIPTTLTITGLDALIDGGGLVTLRGLNTRILRQLSSGTNSSTLTLQHITLTNGRATGANDAANGGAIQSLNQSAGQDYPVTLNIINVTFLNNDVSLTSFNTGNAYDFGGGAIYSSGGFVHVEDSTFTNNDAQNAAGGAIHILRSALTISNSTFTTNSAIGSVPANSQGGAIYIDGLWPDGGLTLTISGSTFTGNTTYNSGGAIYFNLYENAGGLTVQNSTFSNNAVVGGSAALGGAISGGGTTIGANTGNPPVIITGSTFNGNSVRRSSSSLDGSGGALAFAQQAAVTIANSTFSGNSALGSSFNANGGAIYIINNSTRFEIIHSTIANNTAGWVGGGITSSSNGRIRNSIIANNSANNGGNGWNIQQQCSAELQHSNSLQWPPRNPSGNFFNEVTCFSGKSATNQTADPVFRDPLLLPLLNYGGPTQTIALAEGSPAIDAADAAVCAAAPISSADQRGQLRPLDGDGINGAQCDIGAFETVPNQAPLAAALLTPANGQSLTGTTSPTLSWGPAGFASSYRLQVSSASDFSTLLVDVPTSSLTYTVPALFQGDQPYYWRVQSINTNDTTFSAERSFYLASAATGAPTLNAANTVPILLTWNHVAGATGYWVQMSRSTAFAPADLILNQNTFSPDTLSFSIAPETGTYWWRVAARRPDGITWDAWSEVQPLTLVR